MGGSKKLRKAVKLNMASDIKNKMLTIINNVKFSVAYAHFIFNLVSVILGYIFFSLFDRILNDEK